MTNGENNTGPFPLHEVLEKEFEKLHSAAPDATGETAADPLTDIYGRIHAQNHTALCLSGGGIRSASFGLGVLQGLAQHNLLAKFDYLSTVSGGGYIGSWLTAWIHRHPQGRDGVIDELRSFGASK